MKEKSALLAGATGLVGGHCLDFLLKTPRYQKVTVIGRRPLEIRHPKLETHLVDFEKLEDYSEILQADDVFCCLGSTIKKAGSQSAFRQVDLVYPSRLAEFSSSNGSSQFLLVSSIGADASSKVFYSRTKGQAEKAVSNLDFRSVLIFQPSLLLGQRSEFRLGEKLGEKLAVFIRPLLAGKLKKYRPIAARDVARAMVEMVLVELKGIHIFPSDQIQFFCDRLEMETNEHGL